jgi:cell division protein FtsW
MVRVDWTLVLVWAAVLGLGVVMVASSAMAMSSMFVVRHVVYLLIGLMTCAMVFSVPLAWWEKFHRLAWLAAVVLCAVVLIPGVGLEVNGARRWIGLGSFSLQASEFAKFFLLLYLAPVGMMAVVAGLLLLEPDFGSVVVLGVAASGMFFVAGARLRHFLLLVAAIGAVFLLLAIVQPYRLQRLVSFTDPWAFAYGSGYQLTQALIAFGRGEITGLGLGEGIQKLFYLPEAHNDFIFAVIAEELGLLGAVAVVGLFAVLVVRVLRIAKAAMDERRPFAAYLTYGVGLILGIQCLINFGVNTGVLPTKGLTLPFVSFGGNSLMVSCAMLGLVLRAQLEGKSRG